MSGAVLHPARLQDSKYSSFVRLQVAATFHELECKVRRRWARNGGGKRSTSTRGYYEGREETGKGRFMTSENVVGGETDQSYRSVRVGKRGTGLVRKGKQLKYGS